MPLRRWIFGLLLLLLGFEAYTRFPSLVTPLSIKIPAESRELVLVFHGSGGASDSGLQRIAQRFSAIPAANLEALFINWSPLSDNIFRAAAHGEHLGSLLGDDLARKLPKLQRLTLVAHSAGAYWLEPLCEAYRAATKNPVFIEMIYLDPIGTKGSWDYAYGYRHYGHCADFARAYINLDDGVPGTNGLLEQAENIDVTQAAGKAQFMQRGGDGHYWPVEYFLALPIGQWMLDLQSSQVNFPRGGVVPVR